MIHVLITGANGQLGESFKKINCSQFPNKCKYTDVHDLDLTDSAAVRRYFNNFQFDYIVNCAAYTSVDLAEKNKDEAFAVNAEVPKLLGEIAKDKSIHLIHISTDYVFSGKSSVPYKETSKPGPLSVYGKSKLAGEKALWNHPYAIVLRSAWLYSEFGNNFAKTMLRLGHEKESLDVVSDQTGSPTYATDLATVVLRIIQISEQKKFQPGILHYTNEGICSWFDFAREIMDMAGLPCKIMPVATQQYPLPARRPAYSVLSKSKIKKEYGIVIPHWKKSLKIALDSMLKN